MNEGIIFNIQKFSIHDGPGIRTTIFFKGCPLRCQWCSNPESQLPQVQILYTQNKCLHCLSCQKNCKNDAISYLNKRIIIDHQKCMGCLQCVNHCPGQALKNEGEHKEIDEIIRTCMQDIDFYEESHGGVTISGGEAMSQPHFLKELVIGLKEKHIHIAIETTGFIKESIFEELAPLFDLLLFDVKHYDSKKHQAKTNVSNALIIRNLTWAINQGIEILPRIPVIPDFNDSLDDAMGFVQLFKKIGIKKVQLLPFHQFGENKYDFLNKKYAYKNKKALYQEDLKDYQNIFLNENIDCFF